MNSSDIYTKRRELAERAATPCPKCKTTQVQLADWNSRLALFKCRHCAHKWNETL